MDVTTEKWLRYWRNSLADSESGQGALTKRELAQYQRVEADVYKTGKLEHGHSALIKLFEGESENTRLARVIFRPTIYLASKEHGQEKSGLFPDVITPIVCGLWVSREGWLIPAEPPTIPRDLLSPQADDKFTLAAVADQDRFLTTREPRSYSEQEALALLDTLAAEHETRWQDYRALSLSLFNELCQLEWLKEHYENLRQGCLLKVEDSAGAARNILKLYDWLAESNASLPLLDSYALDNRDAYSTCIDPFETIGARCGHPNAEFALVDAQRDALSQVLAMEYGEILAINGPPGTGKTTFVLAVVASHWVNAALKEGEPPLIMAASTNNQAVTNIIEAFGKDFEENDDPFSGRWLPKVSSYGGYFPAISREKEAAKNYQTSAFYRVMEKPDNIDRAEHAFLNRAREVFEDDSLDTVDKIRQRLHDTLEQHHRCFGKLQTAWRTLQQAQTRCSEVMGSHVEATKIAEEDALAGLQQALESASAGHRQWRRFCADESWFLTILSVLPSVARKRRLKRELFVEENLVPQIQQIVAQGTQDDPGAALSDWISAQRKAITEKEAMLAHWKALLDEKADAERQWRESTSSLMLTAESPLTLNELDKALDVSLRFKLFQLAVHYWEARWLLDCRKYEKELAAQANGKEKTGLKSVQPRWNRRMKLTPCIVSTLHSLPGHMVYSVFEGEGQFRNDYLINEIDLLIIDEAGQVAPDVAGASFALAKRALVIGDVHQIKPVSHQTRVVDVGNLMHQQVLTALEAYELLCESGRCVVDGSVMRVAQSASRHRYLADAEPGMFLREHRRCFDEIISFCNDLCYRGLLLPRRGSPSPDNKLDLPPLGYLHIDGRAETPPSGSRINRLEANTIAAWLAARRKELEDIYEAKLEDIVGVVTPFKAQERLITEACEAQDIKVGPGKNEMTVGTVHALQGAERRVVLFSAVYSRHDDGGFIDRDASMLNVAVSRAKDSFLVFGDMDVISSAGPGKPRQVLGQCLFANENSELVFATGVRPDLLAICKEPRIINDSEEHDACIVQLLEGVSRQVDMVSPWISLNRLSETGLLKSMLDAVKRGVVVNVYTDYRFNVFSSNQYNSEKDARFRYCCKRLNEGDINVHVVNGVHSKLVMADEHFMYVGSYNWASAAREGIHKNTETSMLYSGELSKEIQLQITMLNARVRSESG